MKNIKTNWDYSQLAKNYDHRAEYDSSLIKKVLNDFGCKKIFLLLILEQELESLQNNFLSKI